MSDGERRRLTSVRSTMCSTTHCRQRGLEFDRDGLIARSGTVDAELLASLDALPFYSQTGAKSLGREWVEKEIFPMIDSRGLEFADLLSTFTEHAARQVARVVRRCKPRSHNAYKSGIQGA